VEPQGWIEWLLEPGNECGLNPKNGVPQGGEVGSVRAAQQARLTMTNPCSGQLILGTDRRNPLFTVYAHEEGDQEELHVYYGLELLEVVPDDPENPNFKMLVGRLYNAGLKLGVLEQTFQKDGKTIQRWGRALRSRNAQELIRVLEGRQASRKFSAEIQAYVRVRWAELAGAGLYGIGKRLREEIAAVFGVKLSPETLRPLIGELKRGWKEGDCEPGAG
jgi:transposase